MRSLLGRFHRPMSRGLVNNMLTMNNLGDGSTLSLDFTTGVLDPRLTFTRSTTATYINSSGYVTTMGAAPTNDPTKARFDYSPTNIGEPRGLLVEGQATNLTKFSETFTNAYWNTTANNVTAADSVATSPTGVALTASTLTEIAGTGSHHVHQLVGEFTPAASTAYTMSCFVKQPTSNAIRYVQLAFWSAGFGLTAYMNYDLQTGTVGTGGAGITAPSITAYPNGWYRITATATSIAVPGSSGFQLGFSTTSGAVRTESYTASAPLKSIQLFGAQVEIGSSASSYIVTVVSQVTRNPDICYADNISSWYTQGVATMLFVGRPRQTTERDYICFSTGLIGPRMLMYGFATQDLALFLENGTPANILLGSGSLTFGGVNRIASVFKQADYSCVLNGGTVSTSTTASPAMPTSGINRINIGMRNDQTNQFNGHVMQVKYYPTAFTAAQLKTLTTP